MQVGVVGAGIQGRACVSILAQDITIDKIILIDINENKLIKCKNKRLGAKIHTIVADANNIEDIIQALKGCSVCIDMLLPEYAVNIMKASLEVNANYINTAYDFPFWTNIVNGESLYLDKQYREKGLTALLGCGDSPGLVNVFVKKYCDKLTGVESVKIYGASNNENNEILQQWNPGWSIKQAYIDFITEPCIFRNGRFVKTEPFAEIEQREFLDYGVRKFALHSHEENYSVPYVIKKGIQNCEFKYEIDKYAAILYSCGFKKDKFIKIDNKEISVVDLLLRVIFENDDYEYSSEKNILEENEYSTLIYINGSDNIGPREFIIVLPPLYSNREYVWRKFGTLKIDVALPAIVGMKCLRTASNGVILAENIAVDVFIQELNKYIEYKEIVLQDSRE